MNQNEAKKAAERIMLEVDESVRFQRGQAAAVVVLHKPEGQSAPYDLVPWSAPNAYAELAEALENGRVPIGFIVARPRESIHSSNWEIGTALLQRAQPIVGAPGLLDQARDAWHERLRQLPTPDLASEWYRHVR